MRVFVAWHALTHDRKRTLGAACGIFLSILLIFLQLGFLETVRRTATLAYAAFDFDLIMVSYTYEYMNETGRFDTVHLAQAAVNPAVRKIASMDLEIRTWEDAATQIHSPVMLLSIPLDPQFVRDDQIRRALPALERTDTILLDTLSHPSFGGRAVGTEARIDRRRVVIAGLFTMGMSFYSAGTALAGPTTFSCLTGIASSRTGFGLIKLAPGADPSTVRDSLNAELPSDVRVFERSEFLEMEQGYFVDVTPIGVLVKSGVLVAFLVGAIVLFQVLWTEITNRLDEFATLKAAGFGNAFIYRVGMQESLLLAAVSFGPALGMADLVSLGARQITRLPVSISWQLTSNVLLLTLAMSLLSGMLALIKVRKADPADLFQP